MSLLAGGVADLQFIGLDQSRGVYAIPVGQRLVMLGGLVFAAVFEPDERAFAKGHQVGEQKAVGRFNFVLIVLRLALIARADRVTGKGQAHIASSPVISTTAPLFRAGAVGLRRLAVVKKEARVAFERVQHGVMGKNPRCPDEVS